MSIFKKRKVSETRIVRRGGETVAATTPPRSENTVVNTPRWESRTDDFRGFESPPGRF